MSKKNCLLFFLAFISWPLWAGSSNDNPSEIPSRDLSAFQGKTVTLGANGDLRSEIDKLILEGGGVILLEAESYEIGGFNTDVVISAPIRIVGRGAKHTIITQVGGVSFDVLTHFSLENLGFDDWDQPVVSSTTGFSKEIQIKSCAFNNIDNFVIDIRTITSQHTEIASFRLENSSFDNCHMPLYLTTQTQSWNVFVQNNVMKNLGPAGVMIGANLTYNQENQGRYVVTGNVIEGIYQENVTPYKVSTYGILCMGNQVVIANNIIRDLKNDETDPEVGSFGIYTKARGAVISGNTLRDVRGTSIQVKGDDWHEVNNDVYGYGNLVTDNNIYGAGDLESTGIASGTGQLNIADNHIEKVGTGIYLHDTARDISVNDNRIFGFLETGIRVSMMFDRLTIRGNQISNFEGAQGAEIKGIGIAPDCPEGMSSPCDSSELIVEDNMINDLGDAGTRTGIHFYTNEKINHGRLRNNTLKDVTYGIGFFLGSNYTYFMVEDNNIDSTGLGINSAVNAHSIIRDNIGFQTEGNGVDEITPDGTPASFEVLVAHGLDITPDISQIQITPNGLVADGARYWVDPTYINGQYFRVKLNQSNNAPFYFSWQINGITRFPEL